MLETTEEKQTDEYSQNDLQDMLPIYYKRVFPHKPFYRWLSYNMSEDSIFSHREFSFTLMDDVYIRYLSYENDAELEADICLKNPFKIDIGPVMSDRPKNHRAISLVAVQRELIFDIDMTDYDEVRTCCSGAEVCQKCWKFMVIACQIIDATLREDFNFEHILWVFSGRRGIHCWVCDKLARHLTSKNRSAVAEYLNILSAKTPSRIILGESVHHSIRRAHKIVEPYFDEMVAEQNFFGTIEKRKKLLEMIADEESAKYLSTQIMSMEQNDSKCVWDLVKKTLQNKRGGSYRVRNNLMEIQLSYIYPRLDIAVSKAANHLLKAPFCVHPKTGKICVPFNPSAANKFDPTNVPTIRHLLKEIDQFDDINVDTNNADGKTRIMGYRKTGMKRGAYVFEEFLRKLESSFKNNQKNQMEF